MRVFSRFPKKIEMFLLLIYELQTDIYGKRKIEMNCGQQSGQKTQKEIMEQLLKNIGMCVDAGVECGPGDTFINLDAEGATAYGEWDEERRADFISSILGGGKKKGPEKMIECCMCGDNIKDRKSHNAQPVYEGRCCWDCNNLVYLSRRHQAEEGGDVYAEVRLMIENFPSQHKWAWTTLKNYLKNFKQTARPGAVGEFSPIVVLHKAKKEENKAEERILKERKEYLERKERMRAEMERLDQIEAERRARDEEETKKRQEDFEMRLKALEVKEAQRKEDEKREKEEKAREAEKKRAQKEAEKAEKQAKWKKQ